MKRLLLISIYFVSCSIVNSHPDYSIERYRVYESILEREIPWTQFNRVLISDETTKGVSNNNLVVKLEDSEIVQINDLRLLKNRWHDFKPEEFYSEYIYRNTHTYSLDSDSLHLHNRVKPINLKNFDYSEYYKNDHYDYAIIYCYSMPAFNKDYTEAVVYYQYYCGNSRGEGTWFWLKKVQGNWDVIGKYQAWSS
ncbi:MAG: hypothetical protein ABSC53_06605 [Bacteroidota bacterium]